MTRALAAVGLAALTACSSVQLPPEAYRGSRPVLVDFMGDGEAFTYCTNAAGTPAIACANRFRIWIENPCLYQGAYAALLCHELGHVNGWPGDHPRT